MSLLRYVYLLNGTCMLLSQILQRRQPGVYMALSLVTIIGSVLSFALNHKDEHLYYWPFIIWNVICMFGHVELTNGFEHTNVAVAVCSFMFVATNALSFGPMALNSPDEIAAMIECLKIWIWWIFVNLMSMVDWLWEHMYSIITLTVGTLVAYLIYTCIRRKTKARK